MGSKSKTALVTGSGSGIGKNIAIDLVANGYSVIITGRNIENLKHVLAQCNEVLSHEDENSVYMFLADLEQMDQVDLLIEFVRNKFEHLNLLVNNACFRGTVNGILSEEALVDFGKVLHMNLSVPTYLIAKCMMTMRPKGSDKAIVVNMTSVASSKLVPLHLYAISKACLAELSRELSKTSDEDNIIYISVAPGPVLTDERPHHTKFAPMTLLNRVATTQEVSNLVIQAIKCPRLFNGQELIIDGGYSVVQYPRGL